MRVSKRRQFSFLGQWEYVVLIKHYKREDMIYVRNDDECSVCEQIACLAIILSNALLG